MFLSRSVLNLLFFFFFFNDTATTEIYTLSLHDALPICASTPPCGTRSLVHKRTPPLKAGPASFKRLLGCRRDRKSTRLNSSHTVISYAVFCLKKKKRTNKIATTHSTEHMIQKNTSQSNG